MTPPPDAKPHDPQQRQALEAAHTHQRLVELRLHPVQGTFDVAHLKEIHRRLFQDLPALGIHDVTPGECRSPVPAGRDWVKTRRLESVIDPCPVAYSPMHAAAHAQLDRILQRADPAALRQLGTAEFTQALGTLYAELDYIHPFNDGNSRTLREFTRQLAAASGYALDWNRFTNTPAGRDVLYIARDLSVNAIALNDVQEAGTKRNITTMLDQYEGNRVLPDLLRDAIKPVREIAREQSDPHADQSKVEPTDPKPLPRTRKKDVGIDF